MKYKNAPMKNYYLLPLLFFYFVGFAQPKSILKGKILFEAFPLQKIEIINLDTEKIVYSDADGNFEMEVNGGHILVIGNTSYNYQTIKIKKKSLKIQITKFF